MRIFVMRHGQAEPYATSDKLRPLTKHGQSEVQVMTSWLMSQSIKFDHIFVSPYIRAQQTAKIVNSVLDRPIRTLDFITPSGVAKQVHDYIDGVCSAEKFENILIVSHMPLVSYLVAELTVEQNSPIFQTAGIAEIDYDNAVMKGQLNQLISPSDL